MASELKAVVSCLLTAVLSVVFIVTLDSLGGVALNYAVPIAFIASLFPFVLLYLRERDIAVTNGASSTGLSRGRGNRGEYGLGRRPAAASIHSIINGQLSFTNE